MRRALLLLALVVGCDGGAPRLVVDATVDAMADASVDAMDGATADATADAITPLTPGDVRYRLDWDRDGLDLAPDGTWSLTTDRGYRVTLMRGWLTSYQVSMVPCWLVEGTGAARTPAWHRLWWLIGGVAHAGHDDEPDPSRVAASRVEALAPLVAVDFGAARVPGETYCKAHYVAARADDDTADVPEAYAGERITLHLEATWTAPGDSAAHAFTVRTALAAGRNLSLVPAGGAEADALRLRSDEVGIDVTVYRRPAGWFDGIDFASVDDEEAIDRAVLLAFIDGLRLEVGR